MTSQEAKLQIDACERQITEAYSNLKDAARSVGSRAVHATSSKSKRNALLFLIISLIGWLLCLASFHPFLGFVLIIAGIVCAIIAYLVSGETRDKVIRLQKNLNSVLHDNYEI